MIKNAKNEILTKYEVIRLNADDVTKMLLSMSFEERKEFYKEFNDEELAEIFDKLENEDAAFFILEMNESKAFNVIEKMEFDEAAGLINELEEEDRENYLDKLDQVLVEKLENLKADFLELHPKDVANKLESMSVEQRETFYNFFTAEELSNFFEHLDEEDAALFITELSDNKASDIIENMDVDDAADLINELEEKAKASYLGLMDEETKQELSLLAEYDEDSAGSIMDTNYIDLDANMDVKEAMKKLVTSAPNVSVISTLFVTENGKLYGTLDLKKLIVTKAPCLVKNIVNTNYKYAYTNTNIDDIVKMVDDYDIYALPILDNDQLVGVVTIDDALKALVDQRKEDYNQLAGISGEHDIEETVLQKMKKRMPWLIALCVLDILVCLVVSAFDHVIETITILILFEPVILALAGNIGTQSLAVCVRSISNNELDTSKKRISHILKEFRNGLVSGLLIGVIIIIVAFLYITIINKNSQIDPLKISLIVGASVIIATSLSSMFGCLIPIFFDSLHVDPAAASGPFITTINDIIALAIYFGLAALFLIGT